jgi:hypothetical protein
MEKNSCFIIDPRVYGSWVAFAHDFCRDCKYEYSLLGVEEDKRINECSECKDVLDEFYYKKRQPLIVTRNGEGKNIGEPYQ